MIKDEIEEMAELSGLYLYKTNQELIYCLTYFAKLVAEKEREACAKICEEIYTGEEACGDWPTPEMCANAIRARGQE